MNRIDDALDHTARTVGYERAWVTPQGDPRIFLERQHPTEPGMIQAARLDMLLTALTAERDALAALVAGAYEKCAKVAEDCACPLAREGIKSDRYGFCGHARCGHFHEAADAIRALARIDAAGGR